MGRTTIQVSEELADELYDRKQRGESYEDVIWRLIEAADRKFTLPDDVERGIVYGPSADLKDGYVLTLTTRDSNTVEVEVPEEAMYQLWTEVQGTPWPDTTDDQDEAAELRRHLVDLARGADADMLRGALDALDDRPPAEQDWR